MDLGPLRSRGPKKCGIADGFIKAKHVKGKLVPHQKDCLKSNPL